MFLFSLLQTGQGQNKIEEDSSSDTDSSEEGISKEAIDVRSLSNPAIKRKQETESTQISDPKNVEETPKKKFRKFDFHIVD